MFFLKQKGILWWSMLKAGRVGALDNLRNATCCSCTLTDSFVLSLEQLNGRWTASGLGILTPDIVRVFTVLSSKVICYLLKAPVDGKCGCCFFFWVDGA